MNPPSGCHFHPRCQAALPECSQITTILEDNGGGLCAACITPAEQVNQVEHFYEIFRLTKTLGNWTKHINPW